MSFLGFYSEGKKKARKSSWRLVAPYMSSNASNVDIPLMSHVICIFTLSSRTRKSQLFDEMKELLNVSTLQETSVATLD